MGTFYDDLRKKQGAQQDDGGGSTAGASSNDGVQQQDGQRKYTPFAESQATLDAKKQYDTSAKNRITTYEDMLGRLYPQPKPLSEEEQRRERRRERGKAIVSGISDMVSAIGNLYHTARGGVSMWDPASSLSAKNKSRYDAILAQRQKHAQAYNAAYMRAMQQDDALTTAERNRSYAAYKDSYARDLQAYKDKQAQDKRDEDLAYKRQRDAVTDARNDRDFDNKVAQQKREFAQKERQHADNVALAKERIAAGEYSAWDENGRKHTFKTKTAADTFARQHGTFQETDETTNSESEKFVGGTSKGKTKSSSTKKGGYPKRVDADNTPPSRRNNIDNTPPSRR